MRKIFFIAVIALISSAGCHMCATPYDYCSPVVHGGCDGPDGGGWGDDDMARRNAPSQQMAAYPPEQNSQPQYSQGQYSQSQYSQPYSQYPQAQQAANWNGYNR